MYRTTALAVLAVLMVAGCEKKEGSSTKTTANPSIDAAQKSTGEVLMERRDKMVATAEAGLTEMKGQLQALRAKLSQASAEAKPAMESALNDLDDRMAELSAQIGALKSATAGTWKTVSDDFQLTLIRSRDAFKTAMEKYGK